MKVRIYFVIGSIVFSILLLEGGARLWISLRWPVELPYMLTHHTGQRGRFTSNPELGFALTPNFRDPTGEFRHNQLGFRGPETTVEKPSDVFRIVLMGASTIYGIHVGDGETSAAQLQRRLNELQGGHKVEVINAGVPGWTSSQTLHSLPGRILSLHPDLILIADGRNEVFPQLFNNYRADYGHYWRLGYDFRDSNYQYKNLFRASYLLMLLLTRGSGHLGFAQRDENPAYGVIDYANVPTADDIVRNAADQTRITAFRRNLEQIIQLARQDNVKVILSTVPFQREAYRSGVIPREARTLPFIAQQAERNNELIRALAGEFKVPLVDPALSLTRADLLKDDCHFNQQGEKEFAGLMLKVIEPLLAHRAKVN